MTIGSYFENTPLMSELGIFRGRNRVFFETFARESLQPSGWPLYFTFAETGAGGAPAVDTALNRLTLTTDVNAGDDQSARLSSFRIERAYTSLITGMPDYGTLTTQVELHLPFAVTGAADGEAFIGIHSGSAALTALPTTARHLGIYWDISAGANYMLTSSDGTTQTTVDTTIPVDTSIHILRILWTGENVATLTLLTAAGAAQGTAKNVTAFNGTSGVFHEVHFFIQAEAGGAKVLQVYPFMIKWS